MGTLISHHCDVCGRRTESASQAKTCETEDINSLRQRMPKYEVGKYVLAYKFNDGNYGLDKTKVVKMKGSDFHLELLVEDEEENRYWVRAVLYQTNSYRSGPLMLKFVELVS